MRKLVAVGVLGSGVVLAGCSGGSDGVNGQAQPATSAAAIPTNTGLPDVTFDPCEAIDDSTFRQFGYDAGRQISEESSIGEKDLVTCSISQRDRSLGVIAQNVPWEDTRLPDVTQPITINGREGLYAPEGLLGDSCTLLMRTDFGAVIIDTMPFRFEPDGFKGHACDGVVGLAEAIEPLITDG